MSCSSSSRVRAGFFAPIPALALLAICAVASGCASPRANASAGAQGCTCKDCGRCLVCVCNADLACVQVDIDAQTPHTTYQGRTYYFCSVECMQAFLKDPAKYVKYDDPK